MHFRYYEDWTKRMLVCPQCGWQGTFEQGAVDYFTELMECTCPGCQKMLATVSYPTIEESEANVDKLTKAEKRELSARKTFLAEWEAASLKSADQLPDVGDQPFTIMWDMVSGMGARARKFTVLRHGEREIWREPACWEGYERFGEIVKILQTKYGYRLLDVVPTKASTLYLYGDVLRAIEMVEDIRKSFSKLRQIRANLSASWAFGQRMEQELREEQAQKDAAYLAERAAAKQWLEDHPPKPTKPRRRTRERRR